MTIGTVHAIYIGPKRGQPLVGVAEVKAVAGRGLEGDRYCLGRGSLSRWPGPGRHVTLIEQEALDAVRREFGIHPQDPAGRVCGAAGPRRSAGGGCGRRDHPGW